MGTEYPSGSRGDYQSSSYGSSYTTPSSQNGGDETKKVRTTIRILTMNDIYTFRPVAGSGGFATIRTIVDKYRKPFSLFSINGDVLGGSQFAEHFKGESVIDVMNIINPDICCIGNHEVRFMSLYNCLTLFELYPDTSTYFPD